MSDKRVSPITLPLLKAFYEVGRYRSFKKAADNLGLSQPTIIKQVGELEALYSAKLFTRGRGNNRLTDLGLQLMPLCRSVINGVREIDEFMQSHGRLIHGTLTISAVSPYHITQALKHFVIKYPKIKIKVVYGSNEKALSLLQSGEVDVGLFVHKQAIPGFRTFLCQEDTLIAILPKDHPLSAKESLEYSDFNNQILLCREQGSMTRAIFDQALDEHDIKVAGNIEIGSREAIREGVVQGLGVSVVTEHEHIEDPRITAKPFKHSHLSMKYSFAVSNERLGSRLVQAFLKCAEPTLHTPLHY
ncbi:LysR substrate-binding domain-containing protein [Vibrio coralliirubri]|uniref:LysR substrate-binding domain-containing protein n=1 Tax=Vibrio coralliirubri TaxID=1516159 RepID=UPI00062F043C|nr:LysR substrate-binding domain-containing protein [Vibrio coralliirubri]CDT09339.1 putative Transcriptional regulator, LysR family [Vibrio coralliirubri]CDT77410.1 putative Transcriptional regulator, LysR family [Vibrio coralliirubri]CDT79014.1 putative Transcriptional regulator, LysR family [Vibrio coralliirubri]